ncbi:uncharacterized protein LOC131012674 isoform X1 [Salvia miltiorrhiza]|uniref:uncharacterized protein LOC131012674 isoform X1 n=1 Tax=Salvia miltiorrhiza TaxID=226208 RepID=UPI0025ACD442|nr:uncharacterized protein LOC131012674 isoform X1 [Salvia miltiorrhiza]
MYGLYPLYSAALVITAYPKWCLRSIPIYCSLSATAEFGKSYKRKKLPVELLESVTKLTCESAARGGACDVYLIGTVHNSPKSCQEVRQLIRLIKPGAVLVELCPFGAKFLNRIAKRKIYESNPLGEFQVAYEEANKYGAKVVLGDRPSGITFRRFPVMAFLREFCISFIFSREKLISTLKQLNRIKSDGPNNTITGALNQELAKLLPSYVETLVYERDRYISGKLLEVAREHSSIVAIVGKGHVPGIQKNWKQPVDVKILCHSLIL